jgi:hypothetical protein
VRNAGGEYNQLSTTLLQIENEFYGTIRPKRVIRPGERPLHALRERGVEYVEVRCMDLDPFEQIGIAAPTLRFSRWGRASFNWIVTKLLSCASGSLTINSRLHVESAILEDPFCIHI